MNKGKIIKYVGIAGGAITTISLISAHPLPIILLGICAGLYFFGEAVEKGKIQL